MVLNQRCGICLLCCSLLLLILAGPPPSGATSPPDPLVETTFDESYLCLVDPGVAMCFNEIKDLSPKHYLVDICCHHVQKKCKAHIFCHIKKCNRISKSVCKPPSRKRPAITPDVMDKKGHKKPGHRGEGQSRPASSEPDE